MWAGSVHSSIPTTVCRAEKWRESHNGDQVPDQVALRVSVIINLTVHTIRFAEGGTCKAKLVKQERFLLRHQRELDGAQDGPSPDRKGVLGLKRICGRNLWP